MDLNPEASAARLAAKILAVIAAALVCVIVVGTVYALAVKKQPKRTQQSVSETAIPQGQAYFTGIGKLRTPTAGPKPATVIVSIVFAYDRGDIAFAEELASRTKEFRETAKAFFASRPAADLRKASEAELKEEIRKRYNAALRLGKIDAILFNDYLLID